MWLLIKKIIINYQGLPVEGGEHNLNGMAVPKWSFCRASEEYSIAQTHTPVLLCKGKQGGGSRARSKMDKGKGIKKNKDTAKSFTITWSYFSAELADLPKITQGGE